MGTEFVSAEHTSHIVVTARTYQVLAATGPVGAASYGDRDPGDTFENVPQELQSTGKPTNTFNQPVAPPQSPAGLACDLPGPMQAGGHLPTWAGC